MPVRRGDGSILCEYYVSSGDATGTGTAVIRRSDGYFLRQTSKRALKTNIEDINGALDIISSLRPRQFNWLSQPDDPDDIYHQTIKTVHKNYGFILEEIADISAELVEYGVTNGVLDSTYWKPHDFIAISIQAIKELTTQIEDMKTRLLTLESAT